MKFTKFEASLWAVSCGLITAIFAVNPNKDLLTLIASLLGATMLIFLAKGHPLGQIMTVIFALIYAIISYKFRYYGEMITYLGMTAPTAALAAYEWITHPYEKGKAEVKVAPLTRAKIAWLIAAAALVTTVFYFILRYLGTANLAISTVSITTSFLASAFTILRSPFYALGYAANDVVLIMMWLMASAKDRSYLPMAACFAVFLVNDLYGYINWTKMKDRQEKGV